MVTTNDSNNESRALRRILSSVLILALGVAAGAGLVWAHYAGHLRPLYHALGVHFAHQKTDQAAESTQAAPAGHVHGGMSMPKTGGAEPSKIPGYALVTIVPERQQAIGVRTGKVEHGLLRMSIRAVGILEPDQSRLFRPHTRISGWVTKVHVNFVGQNVKKGDPLLEIYSPDLLSTQEEYLIALEGKQKPLVDLARRRLELWGIPADEIKELEKTRKARETLVLRSQIDGRVLERNALE